MNQKGANVDNVEGLGLEGQRLDHVVLDEAHVRWEWPQSSIVSSAGRSEVDGRDIPGWQIRDVYRDDLSVGVGLSGLNDPIEAP